MADTGSPAMASPLQRRLTQTDCLRRQGYISPTENQMVDSSVDTVIKWSTDCFTSASVDVYLYAPNLSSSLLPIHGWRNFPAAPGSATVKLRPRWWISNPNQDANELFYFNIVESGHEPWDTKNPLGPTFTAVYKAPGPGQNPPDDALPVKEGFVDAVISPFIANGTLTAGGKAAAIIVPLLVVGVALGLWIRKMHINRNNKTADWAEKMDKRMSRVSIDWMAGGDGSAGPIAGSRPASYMHRPSRDLNAGASGFAGRGTAAMQANDMAARGVSIDQMRDRRQSRISFAQETQGDRVSRISFAPSSQDHSRGHKTSASLSRIGQSGLRHSFYDGTAPAVPKLDPAYRESSYSEAYGGAATEDLDDLAMSPSQHQGPLPLSNQQLDQMHNTLDANRTLAPSGSYDRAISPSESVDQADAEFRNSVLQYPAVSMISSGADGSARQGNGDMFAAASIEQSQDNLSRQTGMAPPAQFSSPDEALKQYAALRAGAISPADSQQAGHTMRALYTPEFGHRQGQGSLAGTSLSEDAVVGYNEAAAGYSEDARHGHGGF